ncbi:MAG: hypothetical protein COA79_07855 [Planctomycetota bacterium]|nr:MAG: hypothetical protein COA79_07855 [Planctomycetota bacterium]
MTILFDAFVRFGPRAAKHLHHAWKLEDVLGEMEHCSISGALVTNTQCTQYDAMYSNLKLSDELEKYDHLFALWNIVPPHNLEIPPLDEFLKIANQKDVRAFTIAPKTNNWDVKSETQIDFFKGLEKHGAPIFIEKGDIEWQDLEYVLNTFSKLNIVLTGAKWTEQRVLTPLLFNFKNIHITFDKYQVHYGLEWLTENKLTSQLLFGTNAPEMSMGAHRCFLDYADISKEDKEAIAWGNLSRLLKGAKPPREIENKNEDEIMKEARAGKPLSCKLIDMHVHMLHEGLNGGGGSCAIYKGGPKGILALMKRLGYDYAGIMSWNGVVSCDSLGGNECVVEALETFKEPFYGLANFDPVHYTQEELADLIPTFYKNHPRFIGMKPYWLYGKRYDDPLYDVWWKYGSSRKMYGLMHRTTNDYSEIENLAKRYPDITWLIAHCGANYDVADGAIEVMKKFSNVFAEITLTPVTFGVIDYLVKHIGPERIIYGTDLPMRDPRQQLGWVIYSRIPVEQKKMILGENAERIISRVLPHTCWAGE